MPFREETITMRNPHLWTLSSSTTIEEFVTQYPPSKTLTKDGGRDGYIWVINDTIDEDTNWAKLAGAPDGEAAEDVVKATRIWKEALWRAEEIRNDDSIPEWMQIGGTGPPSKQIRLDQLVTETEGELYKIAKAGRWGSGKWLFFVPMDRLDQIWKILTESIVHGPLSRLEMARCQSIKTATVDSGRHTSPTHTVISLYFEDCFNRSHAEEVLRCCASAHNLVPKSVKPDLWTLVGIDVKNDLGFRPTIFKAADLMAWPQSKRSAKYKPPNKRYFPRQRTSSSSSKKSSRSHTSSSKDQREEHHRHDDAHQQDYFYDARDDDLNKAEDAAPEQATNHAVEDSSDHEVPGGFPVDDEDIQKEKDHMRSLFCKLGVQNCVTM